MPSFAKVREIYIPEQRNVVRKNDKIAAKIRERLASSLIKNGLPGIGECNVAVTYVDLSPDLRNAKVYIMPYNKADNANIIKIMTEHKYYFKNVLASTIKLRVIPDLVFKIDESLDRQNKIEEILHSLQKNI